MAVITLERVVPRPLSAVWAVVSDVAGHRLPVTRLETDPGTPGVGWRFVAVTGWGRLAFADAMVITRWHPPVAGSKSADYAIVKTGRWLGGWAEVHLQALDPGNTRLTWSEEIILHPHALGRLVAPLSDRAVRRLFADAVSDMVSRA
ncbi:MAG: SRPBCC family protein [Candidatus Phosphoribacter sp.]|nr:SRPBCC family protein [Actinomycetales bacterium]